MSEITEDQVLQFFQKNPCKDVGDLSLTLQEDLTKVASMVDKLLKEGKLKEAPSDADIS